MTLRSWVQLFFIVLVLAVVISFVRSCNNDPTQVQLFSALSMMRSDMNAIAHSGGHITSYDNNSKTTFARVYLLLTVDAQAQSQELSTRYQAILASHGWVSTGNSDRLASFCKQGALASVNNSLDHERITVAMSFDATSVATCRKYAHG